MIISYKETERKNHQYFGGWSQYLQLYSQFWEQISASKHQSIHPWKLMTWYQKTWCHISMFFQVLFKPLKQFYSYTIFIKGVYRVQNGEFINKNLTKHIVYCLFKIPIWKSTNCELTDAEIADLIK